MPIRPTNQQTNGYTKLIRDLVLKPLQKSIIDKLKDSPDTDGAWRRAIQRGFYDPKYLKNVDKGSEDLSTNYINYLDGYQKKKFKRYVYKKFEIDISEALTDRLTQKELDQIIDTNVSLIRSIPQELLQQVSNEYSKIITTDGFDQGKILKMLTDRFGVARSRAELIAQDQSFKTMGALNRTRSQEAGFTHFRWVNEGDNRVRLEHQNVPIGVANAVYPFSTGAPLPEKYPQVAVRCRCIADPQYLFGKNPNVT